MKKRMGQDIRSNNAFAQKSAFKIIIMLLLYQYFLTALLDLISTKCAKETAKIEYGVQ